MDFGGTTEKDVPQGSIPTSDRFERSRLLPYPTGLNLDLCLVIVVRVPLMFRYIKKDFWIFRLKYSAGQLKNTNFA